MLTTSTKRKLWYIFAYHFVSVDYVERNKMAKFHRRNNLNRKINYRVQNYKTLWKPREKYQSSNDLHT